MLTAMNLPPGIVRGASDAQVKGRWWNGNLVRWRQGVLMPVGGWERLTATALPGVARRVLSWRDLTDLRRIAVGLDGGIRVFEGDQVVDITPADFVPFPPYSDQGGYGSGDYGAETYGTPRQNAQGTLLGRPPIWTLASFGEDLLAVASTDGRLLLSSPTAGTMPVATPVANAPLSNRGVVVTAERHAMLFGADGNPRRVAWSGQEDYNDWSFADVNSSAGFYDLDIPGWIVNAQPVRGGTLIFTDSEVWLAQYLGPPLYYGFERVGSGCGLLSPYAFASNGDLLAWASREGFWQFSNGAIRPMKCDVSRVILDSIGTFGSVRSYGFANGMFPEFWWLYPSGEARECNRYIVWNFAEDWWSIGALARSAGVAAGVYDRPIMTGNDGHIYQHEVGWLATGRKRTDQVFIESGAVNIEGGARQYLINGAQLDSGKNYDRTKLTLYTREAREGTETAVGPATPSSSGWCGLRGYGRDVRVRLTEVLDGDWSVGEFRLDVVRGGSR